MQNTSCPDPEGEHPLDKAARLVGGRPALAKICKVSVSAVGNWKKRKQLGVPVKQSVRIERATNCAVPREALRPLDYLDCWPELQGRQTVACEGAKV
ncbi:MAG: YdaS family helix-turn-helix protein [Pseudomonadota bacterium]